MTGKTEIINSLFCINKTPGFYANKAKSWAGIQAGEGEQQGKEY